MNFGDILDQWEESSKKKKVSEQKSSKKANPDRTEKVFPPEPELKKIDPLTLWMRRYGVEDKDAVEKEQKADSAERRQRLLHKKPDATIDLHGLTRDEAWTSLEAFFQDSRRRGFEKLLVIHGKGNHSSGDAVLKRTVRDFVERCSFAGESGQGNASQGGGGATWVLLKETKDRKNTY
ncbi:MAG: Smr/MutS family protein [Treponema sp.]|jgi:DNA-nicking Smr family endonuclease|nr:Smr/MutS family protein [Treponema sp.]